MYSEDYARLVLRDLDEEIRSRAVSLAAGNVTSYEQYREAVGFLRGLRAARAHLLRPFASDVDGLPPEP
jgi:hypothetical protein